MEEIKSVDIKNFVSYLVVEFQKNIAVTTQNIVVHAATKDTLQRICDQLPNYGSLYEKTQTTAISAESSNALESNENGSIDESI